MTDPRTALEEAFKAIYGVPGLAWFAGDHGDRFRRLLDAEAWTSAAEMLVPDGWRIYTADMSIQGRCNFMLEGPKTQYETDEDGCKVAGNDWFVNGVEPTPALALAAACIKAKEAGDGR